MIHKKLNYRQLISLFFILTGFTIQAQIGTPLNPTYNQVQTTAPTNYYNSLIGLSGTALRTAIQNLVVNSTTKGQNYGDAWLALREADENPANTNQVWQIYIEQGIDKADQNTGGSTGWNREHVFPQTRGGFSDGTSTSSDGKDVYFSTTADNIAHAHGDEHHLRASFVGENSNRGSLDFADVSGPRTKDAYFYEPPLSAKGDVARSLFYMAVRYNALSLAAGDQDGQIIGDLTALLQWHKLDVPDDYEMRRNNVVYDWQNNRNPFVDMPDLVDYIWGDKQGVAWPGTGTVYIIVSSVNEFPLTAYGAVSIPQSYTVEGTELGTILNIDAPTHFQISLTTNDADFTKHLELSTTTGVLASTTIYVRFAPESAVGGQISETINHYSDTKTATLTVSGIEGNPALVPIDIYTQDFETNCAPDWVIYSVSSNADWTCDIYGRNSSIAIAMNNYNADTDSEDWLISPLLDITGYTQPNFKYWMEWDYTGSTVELLYSTNYSGSGDPTGVTWTKVDDVLNQDNWTEYISNLQSIPASSFYLAFKHTSGNTSGFSSRINLDDISLTGIAAIPSITTSVPNLSFVYTAPNTSSTSQNYTLTAENLQADVNLTADAPFQISLDNTTWNTSVTVLQANAANETVYVRLSPTTDYLGELKLRVTHSSTNATNHIVDLIAGENTNIPTDADLLTRDKTLDIVTWNLEWFGESNKSDPDWTGKLASVTSTMLDLDADIYALQEVIVDNVNGDYLTPLVDELNAQAGAGTYIGIFGPRYSLDDRTPTADWPAQRVCYIYRAANFSNTQSESMFSALYPNTSTTTIAGYTGDASTFWASGRLPFLFQADVTIDGLTVPVDFINIHAKCCSDSKDRKTADALFLKDELDASYDTDNVIVLGDYNDYYEGSMSGGDSPYISWFANANEDYLRGIGASIDHISISNELYFEYQSLTNNGFVGSTTVSDHDPVLLRLKLDDANFEGQVVTIDGISDKEIGTEPFVVNAQSSNKLPLTYEVLSGPANFTGNILSLTDVGTVLVRVSNAGDENTMAANAEEQFNVVKGNQTITFDLASEVSLSEGSISLSASSSSGLVVSFSVVSGSGTISGNTLSFTEAGNVVVKASQAGDDKYNPASSVQKTISVVDGTTSIPELSNLEFTVYPNPNNGIITIKHDFNNADAVIKIYSSAGLLMESKKLKDNSVLDLSHLGSGVYIIKIVSKKALGSKTIIIE